MVKTAEIIINAALKRNDSIGAHYRIDSVNSDSKSQVEDIQSGKIFIK